MKDDLTHFNKDGEAHMVDVTHKKNTHRIAVARGHIIMQKNTLDLVRAQGHKKGDVLARHKDRYSCEISTTLNLGGDSWPIYLDPTGKQGQAGVKVDLKQGDMLIYSGCDLEHWREEFTGKDCGQVFLHYNHADGRFAKTNLYDKRPILGIPKLG